ncbi:T9SS type A sorting domain-containing protein [candidate division WOR-3 bacterium]|nr:T9SS type A sorting domain-containing protein [candidate division WOR-3 bacterium]
MKKLLKISFIVIVLALTNSRNFLSTSLLHSYKDQIEDLWGRESLNINLIGMWNFGSPRAIFSDSSHIYLGSGGSVIIYDASNTFNPQKIGTISFPGREVIDIYILDTLMLVADSDKGSRIVNVSDPYSPVEVGLIESGWAKSIFAKSNLAYVGEYIDSWQLSIYDISDVQNPSLLGACSVTVWIEDVIVDDNYAYMANFIDGLRIFDVADSTNPYEISNYALSGYTVSLDLYCDTLLLVTSQLGASGLWIFNVRDPHNPILVAYDTTISWGGDDVCHFSHYAYVSSAFEGTFISDINDPSNPFVVGIYVPPCFLLQDRNTNIGPYLYIGECGTLEWLGNALRTIDASDPTNPVSIDYDIIPDKSQDVDIQGNYVYVANFASGMYILDISDSTHPIEISNYNTPGLCNSIEVRDSIVYLADTESILLLNVKDPNNPQKISELPLLCDGFGMALNYPYLYVTSEWTHHFTIVDVAEPQNPFITGFCHLNGFPTYISYKDTFAFVSVSLEGIAVINVADVYNPSIITYLPLPGYARGNANKDNYLYVATNDTNYICVIDITNPSSPILENTVPTIQHYPFGMDISDTFLYVAEQIVGIEVFNISSAPSIQSVGYYAYQPLGAPLDVTCADGLAYLVDQNGIFIFQYIGGSGIQEKPSKKDNKQVIFLNCYPSAFSKKVSIEISSIREENINLKVFNISGRKIKDIFTGKIKGKRLFTWNGLNNNERKVSSGVYFLKMTSENSNYCKKLVFIRR